MWFTLGQLVLKLPPQLGFCFSPFLSLVAVGVKVGHRLENLQTQRVMMSLTTILAAAMSMIMEVMVQAFRMEVTMEVELR